ncbi:endonuclease VII domain-containing protein [Streptomyces sp. CC77]|uniref:endonuclease VII domain-containing protein n=1 Tax=Streptomyces sp. CC77 TaxID=1906739 RepID=UPI0009A0F456|nr:endonuclease VII domain-containing protein [Streptomyces sp. CC77]
MKEDEKRCSRCGDSKPRADFAKNRSSRDGLQSYCRPCWADYHQQRQLARGMNIRPRVPVPPGHKFCRPCGMIKPHSEWNRNRSASDGLSTACKECLKAKGRAGHLRRQYGITEAELGAMIEAQAGVCAICQSGPPEHVDHCHKTGRVRGVLCFNCNSAIGKLRDDPAIVRRAATYLEGNAWKPTLEPQGVCRLPS